MKDFEDDKDWVGNKKDAYTWVKWALNRVETKNPADEEYYSLGDELVRQLAKAGTSTNINKTVKEFKRDNDDFTKYVPSPVSNLIKLISFYSQVCHKGAHYDKYTENDIDKFIQKIQHARASNKKYYDHKANPQTELSGDALQNALKKSDAIIRQIMRAHMVIPYDLSKVEDFKAGYDFAGTLGDSAEEKMHFQGILYAIFPGLQSFKEIEEKLRNDAGFNELIDKLALFRNMYKRVDESAKHIDLDQYLKDKDSIKKYLNQNNFEIEQAIKSMRVNSIKKLSKVVDEIFPIVEKDYIKAFVEKAEELKESMRDKGQNVSVASIRTGTKFMMERIDKALLKIKDINDTSSEKEHLDLLNLIGQAWIDIEEFPKQLAYELEKK